MNENIRKEVLESIEQMLPGAGEPAREALALIVQYGGIDGSHHKSWVLDQVTRALTGGEYEKIIAWACEGEYGPSTYGWDKGIAP